MAKPALSAEIGDSSRISPIRPTEGINTRNNNHLSLMPMHKYSIASYYTLSALINDLYPRLELTTEGFKGVTTKFIKELNIPREHMYLTQELPKDLNDIEDIAISLRINLFNYFSEVWNPKEKHLVLASAGADSRILLRILYELSLTKDLGEYTIICSEPEGKLFREAIEKIGFDAVYYNVWNEKRFERPDYFRIGNFETNVNAFNAPLIEYWPKGIEKDTTLVMGLCGGEVLDYPIGKAAAGYPTENRFDDLRFMYSPYELDLCQIYAVWNKVLLPYLGYEYLDTAFRIHKDCFKRATHAGQPMDAIRAKMLEILGDTTPCFSGHAYNFTIGEQQIEYIKQSWRNSKLYKDYKHLRFVKEAEPWRCDGMEPRKNYDMRLYGLATAYEKAFV